MGVVAHQRTTSLALAGREQVYFTDAFVGSGGVRSWALRTGSDPATYANQVRAAIAAINPRLVVTRFEPMETVVRGAQASTRFFDAHLAICRDRGNARRIGLYGVLATAVRQRTSEIGVRMALGAGKRNIFQLIVGQGFRLSAVGITAGLIAALLLTRLMASMLVGVRPTDPQTFVAMALVFFAISALASWLPARRAASLDPTTALREQWRSTGLA